MGSGKGASKRVNSQFKGLPIPLMSKVRCQDLVNDDLYTLATRVEPDGGFSYVLGEDSGAAVADKVSPKRIAVLSPGEPMEGEELVGHDIIFKYNSAKWQDYIGDVDVVSLDGVAGRVVNVAYAPRDEEGEDPVVAFTVEFASCPEASEIYFFLDDFLRDEPPGPERVPVSRVAF